MTAEKKSKYLSLSISISSFFVGFIFAIGLAQGGMLDPKNIQGFLDITGNWKPALMFVMVGAISVHLLVYQLIKNRTSTLWVTELHIPKRRDITPQLLVGSLLFGIGWGIGGYCPGPALVAVVSGQKTVVLFVLSMIASMWAYQKIEKYIPLNK